MTAQWWCEMAIMLRCSRLAAVTVQTRMCSVLAFVRRMQGLGAESRLPEASREGVRTSSTVSMS